MNEILIVAGMSGAGRSTVSAALEDLGWSVIDNLPVDLIVRVAELAASGSPDMAGLAFVVGRSGAVGTERVGEVQQELRSNGFSVHLLFLDAPDEVLVRRFEGTRRRHPLPGASVGDAIAKERQTLSAIRDGADFTIDTGYLNSNQLRQRVAEMFRSQRSTNLKVNVLSFGFSNGIPRDADIVLDCRFLPNPHWDEALRPHTGLQEDVASFVLSHDDARHFVDDVVGMLSWQLPAFAKEGKAYLTVAIGCTGGRHRSVAIAEEVGRQLGLTAAVFHRDIDRL